MVRHGSGFLRAGVTGTCSERAMSRTGSADTAPRTTRLCPRIENVTTLPMRAGSGSEKYAPHATSTVRGLPEPRTLCSIKPSPNSPPRWLILAEC
jgi:hypothetical protein